LKDSEECVRLKPNWGKGFGRKGAALFKLGALEEAAKAYKDGIAVERTDALEEGLQEVESAMMARANRGRGGGGGFPGGLNLFGPDVLARIAANEKLAPYLADKELMAKLNGISSNPQALMGALQGGSGDKRLMELLMFALGGGATPGEMDEEDSGAYPSEAPTPPSSSSSSSSSSSYSKAPPPPLEPKEAPPPESAEEREVRLEKEAKRAQALKVKEEGNAAYKARKFDEALALYRQAATIDPEDIVYTLNEASVHFEEKRWEDCLSLCAGAIERGREIRAPFKDIAKAYARMGNVKVAQGALEEALEFYEKAQLEHRTDEVTQKIRKVKADAKVAKEKAYINPALGLEAKERGNTLFKEGKFAEAIKEYSDAIARDPTNATYYQNRAAAFAKVMNYGSALEDCEKALKIDPKFGECNICGESVRPRCFFSFSFSPPSPFSPCSQSSEQERELSAWHQGVPQSS